MASTNHSNDLVCLDRDNTCLEYPFVIGCIIAVVCMVGVAGNCISFNVFQSITVKSSTIYLFQALAIIDNLLLICMFPYFFLDPFLKYTGIFTHYFECGYNYIVRLLFYPLSNISQMATVWVTVLIAFNRYIAVCKPYQTSNLSSIKQTKIFLVCVLIFSVVYHLPLYFESTVVSLKYGEIKLLELKRTNTTIRTDSLVEDNQICFCLLLSNFYHQDFYITGYFSISYLVFYLTIPLTILAILNSLLIIQLKKLRKRKAEMQTIRQQQDNNVTLVLIVVVLVFIFCQTPALVNRILWIVLNYEMRTCPRFQFYFKHLSNMMISVNSAVNFFIYLFFNIRFKQIFAKSFCGKYLCCCVTSCEAITGLETQHTFLLAPLTAGPSVNKGKVMNMVENKKSVQNDNKISNAGNLNHTHSNYAPVVRKKPQAMVEIKFKSNFSEVCETSKGTEDSANANTEEQKLLDVYGNDKKAIENVENKHYDEVSDITKNDNEANDYLCEKNDNTSPN